jgi:uncharacterized paraquat-inducible protein A
MADICYVCDGEVQGGFTVSERRMLDGTPVISVDGTDDRDNNVCDGCNIIVHFACSRKPESGYCNRCLRKLEADEETQ